MTQNLSKYFKKAMIYGINIRIQKEYFLYVDTIQETI
jgi:hypothetical protein